MPPPPQKRNKTKKRISIKMFCTLGPNLAILALAGHGLWCGQIQNGVNLYFLGKFYLEGQGQLPFRQKGILTKVFAPPSLVMGNQ